MKTDIAEFITKHKEVEFSLRNYKQGSDAISIVSGDRLNVEQMFLLRYDVENIMSIFRRSLSSIIRIKETVDIYNIILTPCFSALQFETGSMSLTGKPIVVTLLDLEKGEKLIEQAVDNISTECSYVNCYCQIIYNKFSICNINEIYKGLIAFPSEYINSYDDKYLNVIADGTNLLSFYLSGDAPVIKERFIDVIDTMDVDFNWIGTLAFTDFKSAKQFYSRIKYDNISFVHKEDSSVLEFEIQPNVSIGEKKRFKRRVNNSIKEKKLIYITMNK